MIDHVPCVVPSAADEAGVAAMLEGLPNDVQARH
jgi:hypothetical protein